MKNTDGRPSKLVRFEVFKRDAFRCIYCGAMPPDAVLEIDHVVPLAAGGSGEPENLVTSCFTCNRGKRDVPLERTRSTIREQRDVLEERHEQLHEYRRWVEAVHAEENAAVTHVNEIFGEATGYDLWPEHRPQVRRFIREIGLETVAKAMEIAIGRTSWSPDRKWRYFCGICWRRVREKGGRDGLPE